MEDSICSLNAVEKLFNLDFSGIDVDDEEDEGPPGDLTTFLESKEGRGRRSASASELTSTPARKVARRHEHEDSDAVAGTSSTAVTVPSSTSTTALQTLP